MTTQHTPTPWIVHEWGKSFAVLEAQVRSTTGPGITMSGQAIIAKEVAKANARFICQSVTCHEELVAALTRLLEWTGAECEYVDDIPDKCPGDGSSDPCAYCEARAVLAKAKTQPC